jgi:hypothetical protein
MLDAGYDQNINFEHEMARVGWIDRFSKIGCPVDGWEFLIPRSRLLLCPSAPLLLCSLAPCVIVAPMERIG